MMRIATVTALFADLPETELLAWIERGWVRPRQDPEDFVFHEIDVARIRLIRDLRFEMEVREDTIPLVLSLLDQVYSLRGSLQSVLRAVNAQPAPIRDTILAAIRA
jgi:chaperone modulatory protein CbpM